ncbi:heat-inducible transcriptional repressor HrcA [Geosporobacter ferrireducens]|uniref:Heat-inducible transcription repressor HrcA n=1 Tax=Geosporobacter ferrireducens TaxID=1424294 RepID=A0A1D8GC98_9FIRM|nr:heat-inducible transcriptional repressor HrcA [Geosporobacter ferrireducens]AOT68535.1 heat-inducible transcription repressor HrcA [Geosporobacter ferrireducens]MTI54001.1 heat-inducible transcription repressor HrcA [Geosporobacter ferrireducens]
MDLADRKMKILQAIIRDFITTAEPVGSRTIAKKYDLGISSATIRNEMADLEELGYLQQPHTSAGRIPSDKAYRLYVDRIMMMRKIAQIEKNIIQKSLTEKIGELEQLISNTARILSQVTKLTSVVISPQYRHNRLKHIQLIPIDDRSILLVIVLESGVVKNAVLRVGEEMPVEHLDKVSKMLNYRLQGLTVADISNKLMHSAKEEMQMFNSIIASIMPMVMSTLEEIEDVHLYLDGLVNILNLPEYNDIHKAREFITMLDQKDLLKDLLLNTQEDVSITIGKENKHENLQECSIITATYKLNGRTVGKIGVIGPTRMDYDNIVSVVDFMKSNLTQLLMEHKGE